MYLLFEDTGKFFSGRIISETESTFQVELSTGKRQKVKGSHALLQFKDPSPGEHQSQAQHLASTIDLELTWAFAPETEFSFSEVAGDYFSEKPNAVEQAAMLFALHGAPHYFRRAGKGKFKKSSQELVQQALLAIEKKKQVETQVALLSEELIAGKCPDCVRNNLYKILFKPDKNAPDYRAVAKASKISQLSPLALLQRAGAITSPYEFHYRRFMIEFFSAGEGFPSIPPPTEPVDLPLATVKAFSIDDSSTTEIDDALSVCGLGSGEVVVGIHIAAPSLGIKPLDPIDKLAKERLSTVYMPGHKITMLPDNVVEAFTLKAGNDCPAVSLYVSFDEQTLEIKSYQTKVERIPIAHNLRIEHIESHLTEEWLQSTALKNAPKPLNELHPELSFLYRMALSLKAKREVVRGKPETFTHPSYNFKVLNKGADALTGQEPVIIQTRARGTPLDLMVAESMILANSTWGKWLSNLGVPAIYRTQASLVAGSKVRMSTRALGHAGIGVDCYAWSTSPLRRYCDMVNQWQIIACAQYGNTAALVAPFKHQDTALFSIIASFEAAYVGYHSFQNSMERYWTLQYLVQNQISELTATVIKEGLAKAESLPLIFPVVGITALVRGTRIRVRLDAPNFVSLEITGALIEKLHSNDEVPLFHTEDNEDEDVALLDTGSVTIVMNIDEEHSPISEPSLKSDVSD